MFPWVVICFLLQFNLIGIFFFIIFFNIFPTAVNKFILNINNNNICNFPYCWKLIQFKTSTNNRGTDSLLSLFSCFLHHFFFDLFMNFSIFFLDTQVKQFKISTDNREQIAWFCYLVDFFFFTIFFDLFMIFLKIFPWYTC